MDYSPNIHGGSPKLGGIPAMPLSQRKGRAPRVPGAKKSTELGVLGEKPDAIISLLVHSQTQHNVLPSCVANNCSPTKLDPSLAVSSGVGGTVPTSPWVLSHRRSVWRRSLSLNRRGAALGAAAAESSRLERGSAAHGAPRLAPLPACHMTPPCWVACPCVMLLLSHCSRAVKPPWRQALPENATAPPFILFSLSLCLSQNKCLPCKEKRAGSRKHPPSPCPAPFLAVILTCGEGIDASWMGGNPPLGP